MRLVIFDAIAVIMTSLWWFMSNVLFVDNSSGDETPNISSKLGQYHGCWCHGFWGWAIIYSHDIGFIRQIGFKNLGPNDAYMIQ